MSAARRTVVRWVSFEETAQLTEAVGGMGGDPCGDEVDRAGYLAQYTEEGQAYVEAVWREFDERGAFGGFRHQASMCPVFDDGTCGSWSCRGWGDLVSAWWNSRYPEQRANYTLFAWEEDLNEAELLAQLTPDVIARRSAVKRAMARSWGGTSEVLSAALDSLLGMWLATQRMTRRKRDRLRRRFNRERRRRKASTRVDS